MVETRAQHLKKLRAKTQPYKRMIAESWDRVESAQGVFIDILSRVSVKSVRKFKTVSKYWYGSISNKYFAKQQLTQSRNIPSFIVCPTMETTMKLYSMDARNFKLSPLNTIDPFERRDEESMYMISSFNGLICCVNRIFDEDVESKFCDLQIWICNPCTGETLLLPQGRPSFMFEPTVGVAYGSDISDYRVFRIFSSGKKNPEERRYYFQEHYYALAYECEVYSSSTGSWKNIGPVPGVPMSCSLGPFKSSHVFVEGKIYWLTSLDEPGEILSVDLGGRFEVINLPEYPDGLHADDKITEGTHIINLQGSLALLVLHPEYMDIWVWKEDGEKYSWVLEHVEETPIKDEETVFAVTSVKNQILCVTETRWCTYDVDTKIWKKKRGPRTGFVNPAMFPFTESILPCNGGVRL